MEEDYAECRAEEALEILMGKWKPSILFHLILRGTQRFSELRRLMPDITQKTLTNQLRELEEQHIVKRVVYAEIPPRVEYSITEHGLTLKGVLDVMHNWGSHHLNYLKTQEASKANEAAEEAGSR